MRAAGLVVTEEEHAALRRIFGWRRTYWLTFFGLLPALAVAIRLIQDRHWLFMAVLPAAVAVLHIAAWRKTNASRCPRCRALFFNQRGPLGPAGTTVPAPRKCHGCGLRFEQPVRR